MTKSSRSGANFLIDSLYDSLLSVSEMISASLASSFGSPFVQHARQYYIAPQLQAWASGKALSKIANVELI